MSTLSLDLFQDEVYVFTPRGQVKELPEGARPWISPTPSIRRWESLRRGQGQRAHRPAEHPAQKRRHGGDHHRRSRNPSRDWLQFVKSGKARSRIKHWIGTEERTRSLALAKELLEKEGRRMGINVAKAIKNGDFEPVIKEFSFRQLDDLFSAVGHGRITARQVLRKLLPKEEQKPEERKQLDRLRPRHPSPRTPIPSASRAWTGCSSAMPSAATPCPAIRSSAISAAAWASPSTPRTVPMWPTWRLSGFLTSIGAARKESKVLPATHQGCLQESARRAGHGQQPAGQGGVNIDSGQFNSGVDGMSELDFVIEVKTTTQLYAIIEKLRKLEAVNEVTRTSAG
jgi:GTP diphosphokinase / guanosine-3',5'-bis(diphosphate) 3'-diphosphatase